jgi:hypothetical protein
MSCDDRSCCSSSSSCFAKHRIHLANREQLDKKSVIPIYAIGYVFAFVDYVSSGLMSIRSAWGYAGTGSTIKGNLHFGLGPLRKKLRQRSTVCITPEYNSSKTCCCCFNPVRLARGRRQRINGDSTITNNIVRINGAVECTNANCQLFGRTLPRDSNAGNLLTRLSICLSTILYLTWSSLYLCLSFAALNIGYILFGILFGKTKVPFPVFTHQGINNAKPYELEPTNDVIASAMRTGKHGRRP